MKCIIIGNGAAGAYCAKSIIETQANIKLTIISDEPQSFYSRLRLPEFISGDVDESKITLFKNDWYKTKGIDLRTKTTVDNIIPEKSSIVLHSGESIEYDKLVLAVGSKPLIPSIEGISGVNIYTLRTINDALMIKGQAENGKNAIIIGGGLLGLEAANSLRKLGMNVTVVEYFPRLLPKQMDEEGSILLKENLEMFGIDFRLGKSVHKIEDKDAKKVVKLNDETILETDLIIVSAGVRPEISLAQKAGLSIGKGILVNEFLQTSNPDIYAAGDCIEHNDTIYGIWPAAKEQAEIAGRNICGDKIAYEGTSVSTTLKIAGIDLTSLGNIRNDNGEAVEYKYKETSAGKYVKIFVKDNCIIGAILYGSPKNTRTAKKLIESAENIASRENEVLLSLI